MFADLRAAQFWRMAVSYQTSVTVGISADVVGPEATPGCGTALLGGLYGSRIKGLAGALRNLWQRTIHLGAGRHPLEGRRPSATVAELPRLQPRNLAPAQQDIGNFLGSRLQIGQQY